MLKLSTIEAAWDWASTGIDPLQAISRRAFQFLRATFGTNDRDLEATPRSCLSLTRTRLSVSLTIH
jgi:hypothetical protein